LRKQCYLALGFKILELDRNVAWRGSGDCCSYPFTAAASHPTQPNQHPFSDSLFFRNLCGDALSGTWECWSSQI
jgi:hypothetical protein